jgi:hypothetical protein
VVFDTALSNSPNNYSGAGIWQSGNGLTSDGTYIYVNTGNAAGPSPFLPPKLDNSVLKLSANLDLVQNYVPPNVQCLDTTDLDLTSSGPVLFPGSNILLSGGKEGLFYVFSSTDISRTSQCPFRVAVIPPDKLKLMMHNGMPFCSTGTAPDGCEVPDRQIVGDGPRINGLYSHIHAAPVVLQTGAGQYQVYVWPEENPLKMFRYSGGQLLQTPTNAQGVDAQAPLNSMPGGVMSLSANPQGKNAILWATVQADCSKSSSPADCNDYAGDIDGAIHASIPGRFVVFDANTLEELWSDPDVGYLAKFTAPTIADGKVFVANFGSLTDNKGSPTNCGGDYNGRPPMPQTSCGQVRVYGLRPLINVPIELVRWSYSSINPGALAPGPVRPGYR